MEFLQPVMTLFIGFGNAVLEIVSESTIKCTGGDGGRNFNAFCTEEEFILFESFNNETTIAPALVFRQNKNREQTALIRFVPIRTNCTAADDFLSLADHIEPDGNRVPRRVSGKHVFFEWGAVNRP